MDNPVEKRMEDRARALRNARSANLLWPIVDYLESRKNRLEAPLDISDHNWALKRAKRDGAVEAFSEMLNWILRESEPDSPEVA